MQLETMDTNDDFADDSADPLAETIDLYHEPYLYLDRDDDWLNSPSQAYQPQVQYLKMNEWMDEAFCQMPNSTRRALTNKLDELTVARNPMPYPITPSHIQPNPPFPSLYAPNTGTITKGFRSTLNTTTVRKPTISGMNSMYRINSNSTHYGSGWHNGSSTASNGTSQLALANSDTSQVSYLDQFIMAQFKLCHKSPTTFRKKI